MGSFFCASLTITLMKRPRFGTTKKNPHRNWEHEMWYSAQVFGSLLRGQWLHHVMVSFVSLEEGERRRKKTRTEEISHEKRVGVWQKLASAHPIAENEHCQWKTMVNTAGFSHQDILLSYLGIRAFRCLVYFRVSFQGFIFSVVAGVIEFLFHLPVFSVYFKGAWISREVITSLPVRFLWIKLMAR